MTRNNLIRLLLICAFSVCASGQSDPDVQSWNEVNITVNLNDKVDLFVPFALRITKNVSTATDVRVGLGFTFKPTKSLSITPHHSFIRARDRRGIFQTENRSILRLVYKFPKAFVDISHRSQLELRVRHSGTTWRYRPSITIEKALPEHLVKGAKIFVTEEPFYDSASGRFSRNRISGWIGKTITRQLTLDIYYLRQGDNFGSPGTIHVLGTSLKVKL